MYQKSVATKEKILLSAARLLNEKDIVEISIADIAKEAGIAVGLINYHFQTKDRLFYAAIEFYIVQTITQESKSILSIGLEPRQQLMVSLKGFGDFLVKHAKMCRLYFINALGQEKKQTISQTGYEYYLPILQKLYPEKSNTDIVFMIYPIVCSIQMMFLNSDTFKAATSMDFFDTENRHAMIENLIHPILKDSILGGAVND